MAVPVTTHATVVIQYVVMMKGKVIVTVVLIAAVLVATAVIAFSTYSPTP